MTRIRRTAPITLCAWFLCFAGASRVRASAETPRDVVRNIGDILVYVVPSTALGMTLGAKDGSGVKQFAESAAVTMGTVVAFKYSVKSRRPNGNPHSFPSGHTAIVVQSAEFMGQHYGWRYGLPAYAVGAYVGYSRVTSREHHPRDVYAGALIGFLGTYFLTKPYEGGRFQVRVDDKGRPRLAYTRRF